MEILKHFHSLDYGGHYASYSIATKVSQSGFYWSTLFRDTHMFMATCDHCQRTSDISRRHMMPLTNISEVVLFDVWEIDFKRLFPM